MGTKGKRLFTKRQLIVPFLVDGAEGREGTLVDPK